jgi:hypothetical protein
MTLDTPRGEIPKPWDKVKKKNTIQYNTIYAMKILLLSQNLLAKYHHGTKTGITKQQKKKKKKKWGKKWEKKMEKTEQE